MLEEQEARRSAAIGIALAAKALRRCEYHDDIILDCGGDIQGAYKLGNARFSAGKLKGIFESPRQMTDAIKAAVEEHGLEDCPLCEKLLAD